MANLKLRVKLAEFEYEAEGNQESVCSQFEVFRNFLKSYPQTTIASGFASRSTQKHLGNQLPPFPAAQRPRPTHQSRDFLQRLFTHDPQTSQLSCRVLPSGPTKMADTILILLLGHQEILGQPESSALALNEALSRSGGTVTRLDRTLATYLREHWVLKSGKGKGGKYRLSKLGMPQAWTQARHLLSLLPDEEPV